MILGIGTDLCDIRRIERALAKFGKRFLDRCFTSQEQAYAKGDAAILAKRFAAKEAAAKALGSGIWRKGIHLREFEILNAPSGRPQLVVHGAALAYLAALIPQNMRPVWHVSLSDEYPYASAYVILEGCMNV